MDESDTNDDEEEKINKKYKIMCKNYNTTIKKLGKEAQLNKTTTYVEQLGRKTVTSKEVFWRLMHSHSARHSYITNMLRRGVDKETIRMTTGHTDDDMIDFIYQHLTKEDLANKLHKGMNVNQREDDNNKIPLPTPNKQKIEVLETTNKNKTDDDRYIKDINEAKEVLCFLGVDADEYIDEDDETKLLVLIGRRESEMMNKLGFDTTEKFKEIFNTKGKIKDKKKLLHNLYETIKSNEA